MALLAILICGQILRIAIHVADHPILFGLGWGLIRSNTTIHWLLATKSHATAKNTWFLLCNSLKRANLDLGFGYSDISLRLPHKVMNLLSSRLIVSFLFLRCIVRFQERPLKPLTDGIPLPGCRGTSVCSSPVLALPEVEWAHSDCVGWGNTEAGRSSGLVGLFGWLLLLCTEEEQGFCVGGCHFGVDVFAIVLREGHLAGPIIETPLNKLLHFFQIFTLHYLLLPLKISEYQGWQLEQYREDIKENCLDDHK